MQIMARNEQDKNLMMTKEKTLEMPSFIALFGRPVECEVVEDEFRQ